MKIFRVPLTGLLFFSLTSFSTTGGAAESRFVVHQKLLLELGSDGLDGYLLVLRDKRLTNSLIKLMEKHDPDFDLSGISTFKTVPLRNAILQQFRPNGRLIHSLKMEKPYATLEGVDMRDKRRRAILVTQDFGIGMGSYNGPITRILKIELNFIGWQTARNQKTGRELQISLMRSLKTGWNFAPSQNGFSKDILEVSCRPNGSTETFVTTFSRFHRGKSGWVFTTQRENLYWEAEDGDIRLGYSLPNLRNFPIIAHWASKG